jgi:hypothetical protein
VGDHYDLFVKRNLLGDAIHGGSARLAEFRFPIYILRAIDWRQPGRLLRVDGTAQEQEGYEELVLHSPEATEAQLTHRREFTLRSPDKFLTKHVVRNSVWRSIPVFL